MIELTTLLALNKRVYITSLFNGDSNSLMLKRRLQLMISKTFHSNSLYHYLKVKVYALPKS